MLRLGIGTGLAQDALGEELRSRDDLLQEQLLLLMVRRLLTLSNGSCEIRNLEK